MKKLLTILFLFLATLTSGQNYVLDTLTFFRGGMIYKIYLYPDRITINDTTIYSFPGLGTSHSTAAFGDHGHNGYADKDSVLWQLKNGNIVQKDTTKNVGIGCSPSAYQKLKVYGGISIQDGPRWDSGYQAILSIEKASGVQMYSSAIFPYDTTQGGFFSLPNTGTGIRHNNAMLGFFPPIFGSQYSKNFMPFRDLVSNTGYSNISLGARDHPFDSAYLRNLTTGDIRTRIIRDSNEISLICGNVEEGDYSQLFLSKGMTIAALISTDTLNHSVSKIISWPDGIVNIDLKARLDTAETRYAFNSSGFFYGTNGGHHSLALGDVNNRWNGFFTNGDFNGAITWSGGSSANANTAYSWGNHLGLYPKRADSNANTQYGYITPKFFNSETATIYDEIAAKEPANANIQTHISTAHQAIISGTGFVKISGTTLSYDNSTYAPLTSASLVTPNIGKAAGTKLACDSAIVSGLKANGNSGTTINIYASQGNTQTVTRNGNCTYTLKGMVAGQTLTLVMVHEASTTAYTVAFSPALIYAGGTAPTWTNTSGAVDVMVIKYDGTRYLGMQSADFK
ncbi:MAG: hypothetical protein WCK09_00405 [Bacteroidota bacterium]